MSSVGIIEFLRTKRSVSQLIIALEVLREFKANESQSEWSAIPFAAWQKLEQLQEYLEFLVDRKPLDETTVEYLKQKQGDISWAAEVLAIDAERRKENE